MILDSHVHIFPEKISDKAVASIGNFYEIPMTGKGTVSDCIDTMKDAGIGGIFVNSSATKPEQVRSINDFILKNVTRDASDGFLMYGLISLHPDLSVAEIDHEIKFALDNGLVGIKLHPDFQRFNLDDSRADNIYAAASGVLPVLVHTGDNRYDFSSPKRMAAVAKRFPELKVQAAHFGGYSRWNELDCYLDVSENLYFDTSSSLFKLKREEAVGLIEKFGAHRFLFGTDYPMWRPKDELERFFALLLDADAEAAILCDNIKKFYGI